MSQKKKGPCIIQTRINKGWLILTLLYAIAFVTH